MTTVNRELVIQEITHEMGRFWDQPSTAEMAFDDEYVLMSKTEFDALATYNTSNPSGVYYGKCWKRFDGEWWHLVWYGIAPDPNRCTIESRIILIGNQ